MIDRRTGTGKELIARAIHQESKRRNCPFIPFNCSAISRELIESRLFGYRRGAFTGADSEQPGIVRAAAGGTLFLDEIEDLSVAAHAYSEKLERLDEVLLIKQGNITSATKQLGITRRTIQTMKKGIVSA